MTRTVALLGATGYTGRLTAAELERKGIPHRLGGRSIARLAQVPSSGDQRLVDLDDPASLDSFLDGVDVLITCVGPFAQLGMPVVEAAVRTGTSYVDSTGEPAFMAEVYRRFRDAGSAVVPACGFDYIPGDLGVAVAAEGLGHAAEQVDVVYAMTDAKVTRGTARSAIGALTSVNPSFGRLVVAGEHGPVPAVQLPWGEELTVPLHQPKAVIRTGVAAPDWVTQVTKAIGPVSSVMGPLSRAAQPLMSRWVERLPEGPVDADRSKASARTYAVVRAAGGEERVVVRVRDIYGITARFLVAASQQVTGTGAMRRPRRCRPAPSSTRSRTRTRAARCPGARSSDCDTDRVRRLLLVLVLLGCSLSATTAQAAGWHAWQGNPTDIFRTGQYSHGEWIYTNGLRQARGANTDGLERSDYFAAVKPSPVDPTSISFDLYNAFTYDFFGSHRAAHNGDYQLPGSLPAGTGEVAEVRLAIDGPDLFVRFLWNAMPAAGTQIATLTFGDTTTAAWPHNAKLSGAWTSALTVWGTGGSVMTGGTETPVTTRTGNHTTEARIPLALLPSGPWHLRGGSGLAHGHDYLDVPPGLSSASAPGSGGPTSPTNVWGLLFAGDSPWSFDELHQSRQLTSGTDTSYAVVDPAVLRAGGTRLAGIAHGDFSRLLHSSLPSKDGITKDRSGALGTPSITPPIPVPDFNVSYFYNGALQDYAMHVPTSYDGRRKTPLVVYLHGYTGLPEEPFRNPTGLVAAIDKKGWLLASALGRGDWFYRGGTPGEADVLEVIADVSKRYRVDPDRIYLMGHSMGGYGTNNVAMHHPDLFAAVAPAEGTDSAQLHANLRDTAWFEMTAEEDLDSQGKNAKALYQSLSATGYDATLLDYRLKTHEYSSIYDTLPRLLRFFASHTRAVRPAVVSWTRPVGQDNPALHQRYDGAWWLRDVEPAPGVTLPTVTVESMALPHVAPGPRRVTDTMVDEGGPTGRTAAELFQTVPSTTRAALVPQLLKVTSNGARSARVVLASAGLTTRSRLTIRSTGTHELRLVLTGSSGPLQRIVDGAAAGVVSGAVLLPAGTHTVVLTPLGSTQRGHGSLAATGGLPLAGTAAVVLLMALILRRRRT